MLDAKLDDDLYSSDSETSRGRESEIPKVPLIISGWSGSGKNTVARELQTVFKDVAFSISRFTDRPIRPQEENGIDGFFVSTEEFQRVRDNGEFIYDYTKASYGGVSYGFHDQIIASELRRSNIYLVGGEFSTSIALKERIDANAVRLGVRRAMILFIDRDLDLIEQSLRSRAVADPAEVDRRIKHVRKVYTPKPELPTEDSIFYSNNGPIDVERLRDKILERILTN